MSNLREGGTTFAGRIDLPTFETSDGEDVMEVKSSALFGARAVTDDDILDDEALSRHDERLCGGGGQAKQTEQENKYWRRIGQTIPTEAGLENWR